MQNAAVQCACSRRLSTEHMAAFVTVVTVPCSICAETVNADYNHVLGTPLGLSGTYPCTGYQRHSLQYNELSVVWWRCEFIIVFKINTLAKWLDVSFEPSS
jgi:hypothetical protein